MKETIDTLKYAVFSESVYDPPAGEVNCCYSAWGDDFKDLLKPIDGMLENFAVFADEEEAKEIKKIRDERQETAEYIKRFSASSGGAYGHCVCYAEGKNIVNAALSQFDKDEIYELVHFRDEEEFDDYDYIGEENEDDLFDEIKRVKNPVTKVIKKAMRDSEDRNAILKLLDLVDDFLERRNNVEYF